MKIAPRFDSDESSPVNRAVNDARRARAAAALRAAEAAIQASVADLLAAEREEGVLAADAAPHGCCSSGSAASTDAR